MTIIQIEDRLRRQTANQLARSAAAKRLDQEGAWRYQAALAVCLCRAFACTPPGNYTANDPRNILCAALNEVTETLLDLRQYLEGADPSEHLRKLVERQAQ